MQVQNPSEYMCSPQAHTQEIQSHREVFKHSTKSFQKQDFTSQCKLRREMAFSRDRALARRAPDATRTWTPIQQEQSAITLSSTAPFSAHVVPTPTLRARVDENQAMAWADKVLIPILQNDSIRTYFHNQLRFPLPSPEQLRSLDGLSLLRTFVGLLQAVSCANACIPDHLKRSRFTRLLLPSHTLLKNQDCCQAWISDHRAAMQEISADSSATMTDETQ